MALFDERFDGWLASDFEAFEQRKWASNRFNLERGRVRLRLIDLLQQVQRTAQLDLDGLEIWTSPDHPKLSNGHKVRWQAAAFCRGKDLRRAIEQADPALDADDVRKSHVHLGVVVEQTGLRVLAMLPKSAKLDRSRWDKGKAAWRQAAGELNVQLQEDDRGARIEWRVDAEELVAGAAPVAEVAAWLNATLPSLRAVQWLPYDDPDGVGAAVLRSLNKSQAPTRDRAEKTAQKAKKVKIAPAGSMTEEDKPPPRTGRGPRRQADGTATMERGRRSRGAAGGDDRSRARRSDARGGRGRPDSDRKGQSKTDGNKAGGRRGDPRRGPRDGKPGDDRRRDGKPRDDRHRDGKPRDDRRRPHKRPPGPRRPYELGPTAGKDAKPNKDGLSVGARVALRTGLFAGKEGEITAVKKGQAEVAVGMMKVTVALNDLTPA